MPDREQNGGTRGYASRTSPSVDCSTNSSLSTDNTTDPSMSPEFEYLHEKLRHEASSRQEACQLYDHLQKDYDDLLVRFAQAENTIDQLRIGATLTLYTDLPTPNQSSVSIVSNEGRQATSFALPTVKQAVVNTAMERINRSNAGVGEGHVTFSEDARNPFEGSKILDMPTDSLMNSQTMAEGNRMGLMFQIQSLQEDVEMLQSHVNEGDFSQPELVEVGELLEHLKAQHNSLLSEVQTSGDRRYEASFMQTDNLEGQLYRIGLKLEEIDDGLRERLRKLDQNMSEIGVPASEFGLQHIQDNGSYHTEEITRPVPSEFGLQQQLDSVSYHTEDITTPQIAYENTRSYEDAEDENLINQGNKTDPELQELMSKLHDLKEESNKTTHELLNRAADVPSSSYVDLSSTSTRGGHDSPSQDSLRQPHSQSIPLSSHYFSGNPRMNMSLSSTGQDTSLYPNPQHRGMETSVMSLPPNRSPEQPLAHSSPTRQPGQIDSSHRGNEYDNHQSHDHGRNNRQLYSPTNSNAASSGTSPVGQRNLHRVIPNKRASLSSVVDSSRVSTPVFQPRYSGFLTHDQGIHMNGEKLRPQTAETADSGFIGSEGYGSRHSQPLDKLLIQPRDHQHREMRNGAYALSGSDSEVERHIPPKLPPKTYSRKKFSSIRQPALSEDSDEYRRSDPPVRRSSSQEQRRLSAGRRSVDATDRSSMTRSVRDFPNSSKAYEILTLPTSSADNQFHSRISEGQMTPIRERLSTSGPRSDPVSRQQPGPSTSQGTQAEAMKSSTRDSDHERQRSYNREAIEVMREELDNLRQQLMGEAEMRNMQAQMYDELKQRHEDLHRELIRKNAEQQYVQMYDDLKKKYDDLARDLSNRTEPAPSHDTPNDLRLRMDELARELAQIRTNNTTPSPPPEVQMFDDLKKKIDKLSEEVLKTRVGPEATQTAVNYLCPLCSGAGVHRHGNYYYPGFAAAPSTSPHNITVTHTYQNPPLHLNPSSPVVEQPTRGFTYSSPQAHQTSQPSFFVPNGPQSTPSPAAYQGQHFGNVNTAPQNPPISPVTARPVVSTDSSPKVHHHTHTYPGVQPIQGIQGHSPRTVKHIHHYYTNKKSARPQLVVPPPQTPPPPPVRRKIQYEVESSDTDSEWSSGEDETYYHAKRVRPSRSRSRRRNYSSIQDYTSDPYELDTYTLHLSLEDANKAAREMQKISKHMLSSIAADLVNASTR